MSNATQSNACETSMENIVFKNKYEKLAIILQI